MSNPILHDNFSDNTSRDTNALAALRRETLDIYNRLHSINEDILFVNRVHSFYPSLPLIPNLRCGAWYTNPSTGDAAYFKSTDGHFGNWSFNLRRPNLHLLPTIITNRGIVIVDSTRSGKRIPDALAKTIPIWCAVINRAVYRRHHLCVPKQEEVEEEEEWNMKLYTPPTSVSPQEHKQMEDRLESFVEALLASSYTLPPLPSPLRPIWITPATSVFPSLPSNNSNPESFIPIILVSASKQVERGGERRAGGYVYVQGSGDDHELWGMGLTPTLFWSHKPKLLSTSRSELENVVRTLVNPPPIGPSTNGSESTTGNGLESTPSNSNTNTNPINLRILPTPITKIQGQILLTSIPNLPPPNSLPPTLLLPVEGREVEVEVVWLLVTSTNTPIAPTEEPNPQPRVLVLNIPSGKKGQGEFLKRGLPLSIEFCRFWLTGGGGGEGEGLRDGVGGGVGSVEIYGGRESASLSEGAERTELSGGAESTSSSNETSSTSPPNEPSKTSHPHLPPPRTKPRICIACETGTDLSIGIALTALQTFFSDSGVLIPPHSAMERKATKQTIRTRLEWIIASRPQANPSRSTLKRVNEFLLTPLV
ncbi:hypothetical protein JAAARDRAFT_208086 [Jaapia argillacea MUCL 33604]|uniref:Initiator tRNA phosphoribosyl transferase n=1 Tax=Jaapia argillacea MUCL 33604 TaxID=933084 RepID=A0A067PNL1_9AGAM|nr:hypothetical protein JAAARDRAFT_208086 [Jaapia argillacea MUCL 33604]